jgi:hypothetical protein
LCYNITMELDTNLTDALFAEKVLASRRRTPEEKFLATGLIFEATLERMRMGILLNAPAATEPEIAREIARRLYISRLLEKSA